MAISNRFSLLSGHDTADPSVLFAAHSPPKRSSPKPLDRPRKPRTQPDPRPIPANASRGCDDFERDGVLERGFHKKFGVDDHGEVEKPSRLRSRGGGGGPRRAYRSSSRLYFRPGRAYVDPASEEYLVKMSSKYKIFDRQGHRWGNERGKWDDDEDDDDGFEQRPLGLSNCLGNYGMIEGRPLAVINDGMDIIETEEDVSEDEGMTLDEYEKLMEEKKKSFLLDLSVMRNSGGNFTKQGFEIELVKKDDLEDLVENGSETESVKRVDDLEDSVEDGLENGLARRIDEVEDWLDDYVIVMSSEEVIVMSGEEDFQP